MDKLSGLASKFGGGSKSSSSTSTTNQSSGQEDYLDKGESLCVAGAYFQ